VDDEAADTVETSLLFRDLETDKNWPPAFQKVVNAYLARRNVKSVGELHLPSYMRHTSECLAEGEPAASTADRQRLVTSWHHWAENTARRLEQPGIRFWMKLLEEDAQDRFHRAEKVLPVPNAWRQPSYPENFFNRLDPSLHKYVQSPSCRLEGRLLILDM